MSRRSKLTRTDREKRQAKRERRARDLPRRQRLADLQKLLERARLEYEAACRFPQGLRGERAICENCGLEQPRGEGMIYEDGSVTISPCSNCGHEYALTEETFV